MFQIAGMASEEEVEESFAGKFVLMVSVYVCVNAAEENPLCLLITSTTLIN